MPRYYYTVRDRSGNKITNSEEASTEDELILRLQAKSYIVSSIEEEKKPIETKLRQARQRNPTLSLSITGLMLMTWCYFAGS